MNLSVYEKFVIVCIFFIGFFLGRVATALEYAVFKEIASNTAEQKKKEGLAGEPYKKFKWPRFPKKF